jgi:hypothetical protein
MTVISEMLIKGETSEGSTISYEVVNKVACPRGNLSVPRPEILGESGDGEDNQDQLVTTAVIDNVIVSHNPEKTKLAAETVSARRERPCIMGALDHFEVVATA